ncbi:MAG TPA: tRNA uridine(34) 5-carboxymethylaminomethyl modification radical SAM/GNAT enzyme Elp3, partial [Ignavibacteria bacterium]|nr:tRNA uridine(34) 5-carboxymethylaminomethyl modification radical SAM/GNAT enzyme Elp3 [Ignavibacteria bacterium]
LAHNFDPYEQVQGRLRALTANGHPIDKIEMIIIGGTWSFYHPVYQKEFIKECFRVCNNFTANTPETRTNSEAGNIKKGEMSLEELHEINETALCRIIGLSIETRPDYITSHELERLRMLGVTKVEIGVQHLDNDVLRLVKRDMTRESIAKSTEKLRNAGFKVVYHMMPNLPGSDIKKDIEMFKELFNGKQFQPDMLKIYPCMVLDNTELYKTWKEGLHRVYTNEELMRVLASVKKDIPPYVRLIRVIRDLPAEYIKAGSIVSNMRQWLKDDMKKNGWQCKCVRCREIRNEAVYMKDFNLTKIEYETETGKEIFLSYEHKDTQKLAAFLRLRLPVQGNEKVEKVQSGNLSVLRGAALVRELHTYGQLIPVSEEGTQTQHVGLGKRLMQEAELIAREAGYEKVAVISGVGVRDYYRKKLGYELEDTYMVKYL